MDKDKRIEGIELGMNFEKEADVGRVYLDFEDGIPRVLEYEDRGREMGGRGLGVFPNFQCGVPSFEGCQSILGA